MHYLFYSIQVVSSDCTASLKHTRDGAAQLLHVPSSIRRPSRLPEVGSPPRAGEGRSQEGRGCCPACSHGYHELHKSVYHPGQRQAILSGVWGASPQECETDVLRADAVGRAAKADFVKRLQDKKTGNFFDPIKRKKLRTMEASNKKINFTSSHGKVNKCCN